MEKCLNLVLFTPATIFTIVLLYNLIHDRIWSITPPRDKKLIIITIILCIAQIAGYLNYILGGK